MKTVIILFGPKGVGKTHLGAVMERPMNVPFLRVEPLFCLCL